jgi:hypothetical protein
MRIPPRGKPPWFLAHNFMTDYLNIPNVEDKDFAMQVLEQFINLGIMEKFEGSQVVGILDMRFVRCGNSHKCNEDNEE